MKFTQQLFWWGTILVSGIILGGIFLAPFIREFNPAISDFLYNLYSFFCYQQPDRCYYLGSQALAVCSRCLGVYSGFFLSALFYPVLPVSLIRWVADRPSCILLGAGPMIIDALANLLKLWATSLLLRTATGFIWSIFLPFFWFQAFSQLAWQDKD
jgi:uncharacterized membrane protein